MKLSDWLDSWVNTRQKREAWLKIFGYGFLIWELLWLVLLSLPLLTLTDYDSVFALQNSLYRYEHSWMTSIMLTLISSGSVNAAQFGASFMANTSFADVLGIMCVAGLLFVSEKRDRRFILWGLLIIFFIITGSLIFGLSARSLGSVIAVLRVLGGLLLVFCGLFGLILIKKLVKSAYLLAD